MKSTLKKICFFLPLLIIASCSSDDGADKDEEKPTITINYNEGFPQACAELVRGETYNFKAMVTDNQALASYSLDIHHNFNQHTHDDQVGECVLDEIKTAVNPLVFIKNYSIENGPKSYEISISVTIPDDIDTGDYHCAYSITDETGWQTRTSIDIKIVE
ncbi:hypothetical protein APS56_12860 [Pseudalgibacter alginicilyticus]|uniref:DUF4625 domain-containing protein n=1 Tax=Pseudalgibacter alginicilyticus TaxID=1736674 RepID=A0A0P0DAP9_9FLAO|nr:DUF4625 domain-containing protein [Pseudalgibacter alginicilyticus]ALJ05967.1 hypothetical protein APS56_12860 [Pseudalgibacter alginicilyticus]